MTESEWLICSDPDALLAYLLGKASNRSFWAYIVACVDRLSPGQVNRAVQAAVDSIVEYLDGAATEAGLRRHFSKGDAGTIAPSAVRYCQRCFAPADRENEARAQVRLLHDVFGNPFRRVTLDPRWQSETAVALAAGIYAERAFDRMPILADALEEAGCDDADVLAHCRGDGPHVRGCWAVDLILGKG